MDKFIDIKDTLVNTKYIVTIDKDSKGKTITVLLVNHMLSFSYEGEKEKEEDFKRLKKELLNTK